MVLTADPWMDAEVYAPEERLLCRCGRPGRKGPDPIVEILDEGVDWHTVTELAGRHGMVPLLYRELSERCPGRIPTDVLETLRARYVSNVQKNLRFTDELLRIVELLSENDIPVIPYRGPVLASIAYGDIALRQFKDLDLLLRRDDISTVKSLLSERGYDPVYLRSATESLTPSQEWAYTRFSRDYILRNQGGVVVELHWKIVTLLLPSSITLQTVWGRREQVTIQGHEVPALSPEDRLVMLCVHGSRHYWERLSWLCDVATYLEEWSVDWEQALEVARANHSQRLFLLGPLLAHDLFGTVIPTWIHDRASGDSELEGLRGEMRENLFGRNEISGTVGVRLLQSRLLDRRRDRARFWLRWALYPGRPEVEQVALPRSLAPLYSVLRVARLLGLTGKWINRHRPHFKRP